MRFQGASGLHRLSNELHVGFREVSKALESILKHFGALQGFSAGFQGVLECVIGFQSFREASMGFMRSLLLLYYLLTTLHHHCGIRVIFWEGLKAFQGCVIRKLINFLNVSRWQKLADVMHGWGQKYHPNAQGGLIMHL